MLNFLNRTDNSDEHILLTEVKGSNIARPKDDLVEKILLSIDDTGDDLEKYAGKLLEKIAREKEIIQGLFLLYDGKATLNYLSGYAYNDENTDAISFNLGEGLPGQVAHDGKLINLKNVPKGYILVKTGLGQASPNSLIIFPVYYKNTLIGVIELASFQSFTTDDELFFIQLSARIGEKLVKFSNFEISKNG